MAISRTYIIGPTVGLPELNIGTFRAVKSKIETLRNEVVIPHELFFEEENSRSGISDNEAIARRLAEVQKCTNVVLIPGWSDDAIANREWAKARNRNLVITTYGNLKQPRK